MNGQENLANFLEFATFWFILVLVDSRYSIFEKNPSPEFNLILKKLLHLSNFYTDSFVRSKHEC
jgi:hypothetical protein